MQLKEVNHLISTDQIEMEFIEATDKPNNNGSIYDQRKRVCFLAQGHPHRATVVFHLAVDTQPCKNKDEYAQESWCCYEKEEVAVIPLQGAWKEMVIILAQGNYLRIQILMQLT